MSAPVQRVIPLKFPIEITNKDDAVIETISEVILKRPKGKQMRALDDGKGEMAKTMSLVAACASLPPSTIDLMDGEDVLVCAEAMNDFLGGSLVIGDKSSPR